MTMTDTIQPGDNILLIWPGKDGNRRTVKVIRIDGGAVFLEGGGYVPDDLPKRNAEGMWTYEYGQLGGG